MVSTLYVWKYEGGADGSPEAARRGEQRCYAGDPVIDDASDQLKEVLAYINSGEKEC